MELYVFVCDTHVCVVCVYGMLSMCVYVCIVLCLCLMCVCVCVDCVCAYVCIALCLSVFEVYIFVYWVCVCEVCTFIYVLCSVYVCVICAFMDVLCCVCVWCMCGMCVFCVFIDVLENRKCVELSIGLPHMTSAVCFMKSRDYLICKIHLRLEEMWV